MIKVDVLNRVPVTVGLLRPDIVLDSKVEVRGRLPCGYVEYVSDNMRQAVNRWISWLMMDALRIRSGRG